LQVLSSLFLLKKLKKEYKNNLEYKY